MGVVLLEWAALAQRVRMGCSGSGELLGRSIQYTPFYTKRCSKPLHQFETVVVPTTSTVGLIQRL